MPEYSLQIQAQIPAALCAIHNFIRTHDIDDAVTEPEFMDDTPNDHNHNASAAAAAEADHSSGRCVIIAQQMWEDYVRICSERDIDESGGEDEGEEDDESSET
jgi:hypothetical protein